MARTMIAWLIALRRLSSLCSCFQSSFLYHSQKISSPFNSPWAYLSSVRKRWELFFLT